MLTCWFRSRPDRACVRVFDPLRLRARRLHHQCSFLLRSLLEENFYAIPSLRTLVLPRSLGGAGSACLRPTARRQAARNGPDGRRDPGAATVAQVPLAP